MSNRPVMPDLTKVDIAAAYKWALEDRQWLEAENARLKLLAQSAVDYYAVNSQHPSEAHDILREALNPTSAGDE